MLEPHVNYKNLYPVYRKWPKNVFLIKSQWLGDMYKVWTDFDGIWKFPNQQTYHRKGLWKLYRWNHEDPPKTLTGVLVKLCGNTT